MSQFEHILFGGAGKMGANYVRTLQAAGVRPGDILLIDGNKDALENAQQNFPGVHAKDSFDSSLEGQNVYVISNTPAHIKNLGELANLKSPPPTLVEKPLVMMGQQNQLRTILEEKSFRVGAVAYLINFSEAFDSLLQFMGQEGKELFVTKGRGLWTKDRRGDNRPSAGDLEDEATHPLAALLALVGRNQGIQSTNVGARLGFEPFVDPVAQAALHRRDPSVPLLPNASTKLELDIQTKGGLIIPIKILSSFVSPHTNRCIDVLLSDGSSAPRYLARLDFDQQGTDRLQIFELRHSGKALIDDSTFPAKNKLDRQVAAFRQAAEAKEGVWHPMLKSFSDGLRLVDLSEAAHRSHEEGRRIILP